VSQQINLFTPVFLKQKKLFSALTMAQALGLVCLGLTLLGLESFRRIEQVRMEARAVDQRAQAAQKQLAEMVERTKPATADPDMENEIRLVETRLDANRQVLEFVRKGSPAGQGHADCFRALARRTMPGVWLTGIAIEHNGGALEIQGRALQPKLVPAYLTTLKQEAMFRGRSFGSITLRAANVPDSGEARAVPAAASATPRYIEFTVKSDDAAERQDSQRGANTR
jgi:Tfp pilus assembly protein PilN